MSFVYAKFLPLSIILFGIIAFIYLRCRKNYADIVGKYWFFKFSQNNKLSAFFYLLFIFFLLIGILDLRGRPVQIETKVPKANTLMLIDVSSSMLVEDVHPNRLRKSILLARRYLKAASGQLISLAIFSDTQKEIVPFTDDYDILDSRLSSLKNWANGAGGSNLIQAINEASNQFKAEGVDVGNIIIFSDGEAHSQKMSLNLLPKLSVAIVAVGTQGGGKIPIRYSDGRLRRYKKYQGREVVSKLDLKTLKKIASISPRVRYWATSNTNLPMRKILNFFSKNFRSDFSKTKTQFRPVFSHYFLITAIIFLILSNLLSFRKDLVPKTLSFVLLFSLGGQGLLAHGIQKVDEDGNPEEAKKEIKMSPELKSRFEKLKKGNSSIDDRLEIANQLAKEKLYEKSEKLYAESLNRQKIERPWHHFNYAANLLAQKKYGKAIDSMQNLLHTIEKQDFSGKEKLMNSIRNNMLLAVQAEQQQNKSKNNKKKKDSKSSGKGKGKNDKSGKDKKDKKNQSQSQKQPRQQKKISKKKIPAMIKQLMDKDRKIQRDFIDTSVKNRSNSSGKRDW